MRQNQQSSSNSTKIIFHGSSCTTIIQPQIITMNTCMNIHVRVINTNADHKIFRQPAKQTISGQSTQLQHEYFINLVLLAHAAQYSYLKQH